MSSYADMTHYYTDESPIGQVSRIVDVGRCPLTFPTPLSREEIVTFPGLHAATSTRFPHSRG
jgi:hypothetical protein